MHLVAYTLLVLAAAVPALAQAPQFVTKWGTRGSGDGQFDLPRRIAVTFDGTVFASDRNNSRIQKFTPDGTFLLKWGSPGSGDGEFDFNFGVAVDRTGTLVYTAERNNNRIQKFTGDGAFLLKWGTFGAGDGEFNFPIAVDVDSEGNVYVGDSFNQRIQKFTADGAFIRAWGSAGSGEGEFSDPIGIGVGRNDHVYVGDSSNHRVQEFTRDGVFIRAWGTRGGGDGEFQSPRGIGVDADGNVYVADTINNRVQQFTADGVFMTAWGTFGTGDGQFNRPEDVEVDGLGGIYVADSGNNRIQKFAFETLPVSLVFFTAERSGDAALLRWQLAGPGADAAFHVYRGTGGMPAEALDGEPVRDGLVYRFVDATPPAEAALYWLLELGRGGAEYLHGPVGLAAVPTPRFSLSTGRPNPFNPATAIDFSVPEAGRVGLFVFDVRGRLVRTLVDQWRPSGAHSVVWNGRDDGGRAVTSGVYFVRLRFGGHVRGSSVVLLK